MFFFIVNKTFAGTGTASDVNFMIVTIVVFLLFILSLAFLVGYIQNFIAKCRNKNDNRFDDFVENNFNFDKNGFS